MRIGLILMASALLAQGPPPYRLPTTIVPQTWSGNGPPGAVPGNLPGDFYYDNSVSPSVQYFCAAPYRVGTSVTQSPACTSVAAGSWQTASSGGSVTSVNGQTPVANILTTAIVDAAHASGITCNGVANDTAGMNTLLSVSGTVVQMPAATCTATNLTVSGNGITLDLRAGTVLKVRTGMTGNFISTSFASGFTIMGGTLDLNNIAGLTAGVNASNSTNVQIIDTVIKNAGTAGNGQFQGGIVSFNSTNTQVSGGQITQIAGECIQATGTGSIIVRGVHIDHCSKDGIVISNSVNADISGNMIDHIYDAGADSSGAYGNGVYCTTTGACAVGTNTIQYTEYSGVRTTVAGSSISNNTFLWTGDWMIYPEFTSGRQSITGNTGTNLLGGGINVANTADANLNFVTSVSGNTMANCYGSSNNGYSTPIGGVALNVGKFSTVTGNSGDGCFWGGVVGEGARADASQGETWADNNFTETRPFTVTLSGALTGTINAGDPFYVGASFASATKRGNIISVVSTTKLNVMMTLGRLADTDVIHDQAQAGSGTVSGTPVGPSTYSLTVTPVAGTISLFDDVTAGSGATQAHGIVTCVPIAGHVACNAGTITVGWQLNASGLNVAFPASGTLTDTTSGATATITGVTATDISMQVGIMASISDTIPGDATISETHCWGVAIQCVGGLSFPSTSVQPIAAGTMVKGQYQVFYSAAGVPVPACGAATKGFEYAVTDATAPTLGGTYTSGGAVRSKVICDGTNLITY